MTRAGRMATLLWALLALLAAVIATRARYTADFSAFLPRHASATQRLLSEQLRSGPAVHLIIAAIEGGDAPRRAQLSARLAAGLRSDPAFLGVNNGDAAQLERDREFLFNHRYLLSRGVTPTRFTAAGLHTAISDSLDTLASPEGLVVKELFTRDPTGELLGMLDTVDEAHAPRTSQGVWSSPDGSRALLVLETRAAGSDTDAQQAACESLQRTFTAALATLPAEARRGLELHFSGPPVFAVAARRLIKHEVVRLSGLAAALIAVLLLAVYRSPSALAITLVPVASGALAGVAAVALGFGVVHGITLGFGVTLIGEAVDYAIYLFIQQPASFTARTWPTIRLGVLTSICGFAALLPSAFPGLSQLGLYSIAGLTVAALVTRFVLPAWVPPTLAIRDLTGVGVTLGRVLERLRPLRHAVWPLLPLAAAVLYAHRGTLWSRELAALSPVPAADQQFDEQLRADVGAADVRYVVVASAADREAALEAAQALGAELTPLTAAGVIGHFESPARYLPPLETQRARQASLPPPDELRARLATALAGLPVSPVRLEPFVQDVAAARGAPLLTSADLAGTSFARAVDTLLVKDGAGWVALVPVAAAAGSGDLSETAVARLRDTLAHGVAPAAQLLDLKGEADRLYSDYRRQALELALGGLGAILLLLAVALRSIGRALRVVAPLGLAVLTVAALLVAVGRQLTILHLVGMLLIVAVGSNYALFFDRSRTQPRDGVPLTLASLAVANLATVTAFGVLAFARVPVLENLGSTVAPGTLLALLFASLGGIGRRGYPETHG